MELRSIYNQTAKNQTKSVDYRFAESEGIAGNLLGLVSDLLPYDPQLDKKEVIYMAKDKRRKRGRSRPQPTPGY